MIVQNYLLKKDEKLQFLFSLDKWLKYNKEVNIYYE